MNLDFLQQDCCNRRNNLNTRSEMCPHCTGRALLGQGSLSRAGGSLGAAGRGDGGEQVPNWGAMLVLGGGTCILVML